jgi:predicted nucleotidyltransferase
MDNSIPYIDEIISIIVSLASPDQIILFGSYARGNNIDLLIVKKGLKNGRKMSGSIYVVFLENEIGIPVDLLTIDYDRYTELNNKTGYIYKTIKGEYEEITKKEYENSVRIANACLDWVENKIKGTKENKE